MELGHSLAQVPRVAFASRNRESGGTATPSRKLNWRLTAGPKQQQQQSAAQQAVLAGQKVEGVKQPLLPRSSSSELHNLGVPQQNHKQQQPQTKDIGVRSYTRRPSAVISVDDTPLPISNLATAGETGAGSEGGDYDKGGGIAGWQFHKNPHHPEGEHHLMGRQRPRPSSAQEPPTRAPLIHRSATAGSGLGDGRLSTNIDAVQAPMLPLLAPDDDVQERYHSRYSAESHRQHQHHHHPHHHHHPNGEDTNVTKNRLSATGMASQQAAAVTATPATNGLPYSSSSTAGGPTKPISKAGPLNPSKVVCPLERAIDLTNSELITQSPTHDSVKRRGRPSAATTLLARTGTDKSLGGATGGSHKILTPQSFGLPTEAGAKLIVGLIPPARSSSKSSGIKSAAVVAASQGGHDQSIIQLSRSVHETSPPRTTKLAPASVTYESNNGWPCGGLVTSDCGVASTKGDSSGCARSNGKYTGGRNSGITDGKHRDGCVASGGENTSVGGRREGVSTINRQHNHSGIHLRNDYDHGGGGATSYETAGGGSSAIRIPSRGDVSDGSECRWGVHHQQGSPASSGPTHDQQLKHHHQQQQQHQQHPNYHHEQQQQQQQQRKTKRDEDAGRDVKEDRGTLLAGPEGCVEVRELEEGVLVVRRTWHEKKQSPERLNLHRRQLKSCPLVQNLVNGDGRLRLLKLYQDKLVSRTTNLASLPSLIFLDLHNSLIDTLAFGDSRLRLLNYQNNLISKITNLANLPNLIFLDLYNNLIDTLEGPLSTMSSLRVVMVGKNRIEKISNLDRLRKLDVLDLHSNAIRDMEGLNSLQDLRVLNLAGNCLRTVENVSCLTSLTELNLRRNSIEKVAELDALPKLQRLFLSNNRINTFQECRCIFSVESLLELSLDGNPVAGQNGLGSSYRRYILQHLPGLHHLDLKRVTNHDQAFPLEERHPTTNALDLPARHPHTKSISLAALGSISSTAHAAHKNGSSYCGSSNSNNNGNSKGNGNSSNNNSSNNYNNTSSTSSTCNNGISNNRSNNHNSINSNKNKSNKNSTNSNYSNYSSNNSSNNTHHSGVDGLPTLPNSDAGPQQHKRNEPGAPPAMGHPYHWPPSDGSKQSNADTRGGKTSYPEAARPCPPNGSAPGGCGHEHSSSRNGQQKAASPEGATEQEFVGASKRDPGGGASATPEARRAGATAASAKVGRGERERRALKERAEAIEAARECWENRIRRSSTSRARHRNGRENIHQTGNHPASPPPTLTPPTLSPNKSMGRLNSSPGSPTPPLKPNSSVNRGTASTVGSRTVKAESSSGHRSRDHRGIGRGRISRGVGYFELEQRFGKEVGGIGGVSGGVTGPGITLKVYGDVWRWLGDPKVCSLKDQVVEARFSLVHVASLARKAAAIAQTFTNLSCLRLLDNDLRSMKQLERLRPLLASLRMLYLGNNPISMNTSTGALQAWIKLLGPHISIMDLVQQQQQQQQQQQPQQDKLLGSPSSMPNIMLPSPTTSVTHLTPPTQIACRPHLNRAENSNADENSESAAAVAHGTPYTLGKPPKDGPNAKGMDVGANDDNASTCGASSTAFHGIDGGQTAAARLLDIGADPFAAGRWAGGVNNNQYTIEAAGNNVLQSSGDGGGGEKTACSRTPNTMLYSENRLDPESAEESTLASTDDTPSKLGGASSNRTTAGTVMSGRGGDNRARDAGGKAAVFESVPTAADAAFARLVKARDRAVCSTWGGVALAGRGALAACGAVSGGELGEARGDTSAWATSARAASLACNGMVRKVCEAQRRDTDFGLAWEAAVSAIIQDVLASDPNGANPGQIAQGVPASGRVHPGPLPSCQDMATPTMAPNEHAWREEFDRVRTYHPSARWLQD